MASRQEEHDDAFQEIRDDCLVEDAGCSRHRDGGDAPAIACQCGYDGELFETSPNIEYSGLTINSGQFAGIDYMNNEPDMPSYRHLTSFSFLRFVMESHSE